MGINLTECVIIVLAALLFIKPKDIPVFLRYFGKIYAKCLRVYHTFMNDFYAMDISSEKPHSINKENDIKGDL